MLHLIFTLDYEVHGNGDGSPRDLMVSPTGRMLDQFEKFGARLTIMADVAEILCFEQHWRATGKDDFDYQAIAHQLRGAVQRGHDVQLHLHTSWFGARHDGNTWKQNFDTYSFADLPRQQIDGFVARGKSYLECLLQPVDPSYRCHAFRAANWSMQPSRNAVEALVRHGFDIESSVFKWGRRRGLVNFDYAHARHHLFPWRAAAADVCLEDPGSPLWEFPIYTENRPVFAFLSLNRIYRAMVGRLHRLPSQAPAKAAEGRTASAASRVSGLRRLFQKHSWKADFNQCTSRQLMAALDRASEATRIHRPNQHVPFVLIGHSKLFTRQNERDLGAFLAHVAGRPQHYRFSRFADVLASANCAEACP